MGDREHTTKPVEERRPFDVQGASAEDDLPVADAADRVGLDPEEQLNRPDQPDAAPDERRPFESPPERSIAEDDRPEDR